MRSEQREKILEIHKNHDSQSCEFCGSPFAQLRAEALAAHFSKEFTEFQSRLQNAATWIESQGAPANQFPASTEFYKELSAEAEKLQKDYATAAEKIDQQIDAWREALKAKITAIRSTTPENYVDPVTVAALDTGGYTLKDMQKKNAHRIKCALEDGSGEVDVVG